MTDLIVIPGTAAIKLIDCEIDGVRKQLPESILTRESGRDFNWDKDGVLHDIVHWKEYWLDGVCVHRSARVEIHRMPDGMGAVMGKIVSANKSASS